MSRVFVITESQVTELDLSGDGRMAGVIVGQIDIRIPVVDRWLLGQELMDTSHRSGAALEEVYHPPQRDDGPGEHHRVCSEGGEITYRNAVREHFMASHKDHDHHGQAQHELER